MIDDRAGSICQINGYLMVYPLESNITWVSGFDDMTTYTFGQEKIAHSFCSTCGTSIGGKSTDPTFYSENRALNVSFTWMRWRLRVESLDVEFGPSPSLATLWHSSCSHTKQFQADLNI
jgi:hypothetical protein